MDKWMWMVIGYFVGTLAINGPLTIWLIRSWPRWARRRVEKREDAVYQKALGLVTEAIGKRWPGALVVSESEAAAGRIIKIGAACDFRDIHICFLPSGTLRDAHKQAIYAMESVEKECDIVIVTHSVKASREHYPHLQERADRLTTAERQEG